MALMPFDVVSFELMLLFQPQSQLQNLVSEVAALLVSEIEQEVFLADFPEKIEWLKDELRRMQCFLQDQGVDQDDRSAPHMGEVRMLTYAGQDLVEGFSLHNETNTQKSSKIINKCKQWNYKRKIIREVKAIEYKLLQIKRSHKSSSSNLNEVSFQQTPFNTLMQTSSIVGLENETKELLKQLKDNSMNRRSVVSIVGMGGIGKSTLAWKVLNHPDVKSCYEIRAWVAVTSMHQLDDRDLQVKILSETNPTKEQQVEQIVWSIENLEKFSESLNDKKYLVVLDNVWGPPQQYLWEDHLSLKAFPDQNESRIMITTRRNDVAAYLGTPVTLKHLDDQKSWKFFCKKASFSSNDRVIQDLGKKIVRACGGLPLSIVTAGDRLKGTEGLPSRRCDWEKFYRDENGTLPDEVFKALKPSYNELKPELQDCFLRLGFFPKNYNISAKKLTQLWIAEGLVSEQGEGLEAAAESHLDILLERNMIQPVETRPDGSIKTCQIDNSLHTLAISIANEVSFLEIHNDHEFCPSSNNRHRAIHCNMDRYFDPKKPSSQLHSLMFFVPNGRISLPQLEFICKRFKLLKLLHLEGIIVECLPEEIGNLRNLRYLNLRNSSLYKLQPSMSNLKKLLTLDIRDNMYVTGLDVIKDMTNLQNLYLPGYYKGLEFGGLNQLRVMKWVKLASTECLESLVKLTTLQIQLENQLSLDDFLESAIKLTELESLHLYPFIEITSLDTNKFKLLTSLTKLYIKGGVRELPSLENFPPNLMQLTLDGSGLIPFPLDKLAKLPKLSILRLRNLYIKDEKLSFCSSGFLRLKYLELLHLWNLKELELQDKGALGRLRHLKISNCTALNSLPEDMKQLTKLSELHIDKMREAFEQRIQEGGKDHERVRHVSSIKYTNTLRSHETAPNVHLVDPSNEKELDKVKMKKEELNAYRNVPPSQPQQQQQQKQEPHPDSHEVFKDRFKSISARLGDSMVELISLACETNQHYPTPDKLKVGLPQIIANACRTLSDCKQSQSHPLPLSQSEESNEGRNASILGRPSIDNSDHPQHSHVQSTTISPTTTISYLCEAEKSFNNNSNKNGSLALTIVQHQSAKQQTPSHIDLKKYKGDVQEKEEQSRATNLKSYLEHITQEYGQNGTRVPNSSSMGNETLNNKGNLNKYLERYVDVKSDGNCGFRVVADWIMNDQEKWRDIREKMANEVETKRDHYSSMEINVEEALSRLRWYHGNCDSKYWMLAYEDLIPIANLYNAVVMLFRVDENDRVSPYTTILPTYAPLKVTGPTRELAVGHIGHKQHYIHLKMKKDCPIPPIYPYWSIWCNDNVRHWDLLYQSRVQK